MGLAADCESRPTGCWRSRQHGVQPRYLAAAGAVAAPALRAPSPRRAERLTCAVVLAMDGVGSILFHGGLPTGRVVHDGALLATLLFVFMHGVGRTRHWAQRRTLACFAVGTAGLATAVLIRPGLTNVAAVVLVCGCVAAEFAVLGGVAPQHRPHSHCWPAPRR